jgi:hypothetical protein
MTKHQLLLLLASLTSLGCLLAALFGMHWFHGTIELKPTGSSLVWLDMRSAHQCIAGACVPIPIRALTGHYATFAGIAFWCALPLVLAIVFQCSAKLLTLGASPVITRSGYLIATIVVIAGFCAAYVFAPADLERSVAPILLVVGGLLAIFALYTAIHEPSYDDGAYRTITAERDGRLPVTPLSVDRVPTPPGGSRTKS